jgi:hypothetical protein
VSILTGSDLRTLVVQCIGLNSRIRELNVAETVCFAMPCSHFSLSDKALYLLASKLTAVSAHHAAE